MNPFEYVTVLISIVLGLGITQILVGVANLIKQYDRVTLYWPHLIWVIFILLLHIQEWWVTYELKYFTPWRLPIFLFIMLYPINLFVLAKLLFPDKPQSGLKNFREFYFSNYKKIFSLLIVSGVLSVIYNLFILGLPFADQLLQLILVSVFFIIVMVKDLPESIHKLVSVLVMLSMLITIALEWNVWLIE
jgi:hypothetical protein